MKTLMKHVVIYLSLALLAGCGATNSSHENAVDFLLLDGNDFVLEVDRVSERPDAQFRMDDLQENDYGGTDDGSQDNVTFSKDGEMVTIEPGAIHGQKLNDGDVSKFYELDNGTFAGGRFVVWIRGKNFQAELTVYGSGAPIVKSERGFLAMN